MPHGSRIVSPEAQLRALGAKHYLRLKLPVAGAEHLRKLVQVGQLSAKKGVHEHLNHATKEGSWPDGHPLYTVRVTPTNSFDVEAFLAVWPYVTEGFIFPPSPTRGQRRTSYPRPGATNRDRTK